MSLSHVAYNDRSGVLSIVSPVVCVFAQPVRALMLAVVRGPRLSAQATTSTEALTTATRCIFHTRITNCIKRTVLRICDSGGRLKRSAGPAYPENRELLFSSTSGKNTSGFSMSCCVHYSFINRHTATIVLCGLSPSVDIGPPLNC